MTIERPVQTYDFLIANRDKLLDREWLSQFLRGHCKCNKTLGRGWRGSRLRIIQYPWEFAGFLILMATHKIRSYLEIGTSSGGSFLMVDSYLRATVHGYQRSVGYDRKDKMRDFEEYRARWPTATFRCQGSGDMDLTGETFDAAFIDARHIERWVIQDYNKVRVAQPKIIGFHDIRLAKSTVRNAWEEIKAKHPTHWEIIDPNIPEPLQWGIGAVLNP